MTVSPVIAAFLRAKSNILGILKWIKPHEFLRNTKYFLLENIIGDSTFIIKPKFCF